MSDKYQPITVRGGAVVQGGINAKTRGMQDRNAPMRGPYRALVINTYPADHKTNRSGYAVECDVILVLTLKAVRNVPVMQRNYGRNDASDPWHPKPATATLTGDPVFFSRVYDPRGEAKTEITALDNTNGDMVLVDFIENNPALPVIVGALTHERTKRIVKEGDGWAESGGPGRGEPQSNEHYLRHAGAEFRINSEGDVLLDTVGATSDTVDETPGSGGQIRLRVKSSQRLTVELDGTDVLEVFKSGSQVRIDLGEGASERVVLGDSFMSLFNSHTHPTGVGPSGAPIQPMSSSHLSSLAKVKAT